MSNSAEFKTKEMRVRFIGEFANNFHEGDVLTIRLLENEYLICDGDAKITSLDEKLFAEMRQCCEILEDPHELAKPFLDKAQGLYKTLGVKAERTHTKTVAYDGGEFKLSYRKEDQNGFGVSDITKVIEVAKSHYHPDIKALVPLLEELKERRAFEYRLKDDLEKIINDMSYDQVIKGRSWVTQGRYEDIVQREPDKELLDRRKIKDEIRSYCKENIPENHEMNPENDLSDTEQLDSSDEERDF